MKLSPFLLLFSIAFCSTSSSYYKEIPSFPKEVNSNLENFFKKHKSYSGRKIAIFDGDGTVLGQAPHYLADECLYEVAKKEPNRKPQLIQKMKAQSNVSIPYVQNRVLFFEGDTVDSLRKLGDECYYKYYNNKVYPQMIQLIQILKKNQFEVWIITASPEAMYQKFLAKELDIPITNIVGVKSVVRDGKITSEMVLPIPQDNGKKEAIETFVQDKPLFVAGNSRGDREMIEFSEGVKFIVNPDEHIAEGDSESIAAYARKMNWLVVKIKDVPSENFPYISSKEYGIRKNKSNE